MIDLVLLFIGIGAYIIMLEAVSIFWSNRLDQNERNARELVK